MPPFDSIAALDDALTQPGKTLVSFVGKLKGPLVVLGAGGKMGPTLCVLAKRAAEAAGSNLSVIAVSRFSDPSKKQWLEQHGVSTIACDLFDRAAVAQLPEARNVVYLVGLKFGTQQNPALTWAANTVVPTLVCERYASSRIVALSTGNVYPFVDVDISGSVERDGLHPIGEYANACLARERIFEYHTQIKPLEVVNIRLNYAVELRYGVLIDIAKKIINHQAVDVTMGYFNCIWQRDANDMIVRSLALADSPAELLNLTGAEKCSVRAIASLLGEMMGMDVEFVGKEAHTALLSDASKAIAYLGSPETNLHDVIKWTADWVKNGLPTWNKKTNFEQRDGRF